MLGKVWLSAAFGLRKGFDTLDALIFQPPPAGAATQDIQSEGAWQRVKRFSQAAAEAASGSAAAARAPTTRVVVEGGGPQPQQPAPSPGDWEWLITLIMLSSVLWSFWRFLQQRNPRAASMHA
ncbi:hypothetical protein APUTEX25_005848 [Auxenochlorella protothecoides]|uniref:Uncharacterized protein n=1 Tax=Auxenochlorella protothecoides TaxID=3075 RepID=A0A3M7KZN6_AUXPR|nr:hypothetical protein APUTEX25_005848 [Auxenochlorella protothecoides]|eukprot:RMZ55807.1 hypothetical protein APUTEX25_005848 [Auxenochlorella protothecoides]